MKITLHPDEAIEIQSVGKYPQTMTIWIANDGIINHKLKEAK